MVIRVLERGEANRLDAASLVGRIAFTRAEEGFRPFQCPRMIVRVSGGRVYVDRERGRSDSFTDPLTGTGRVPDRYLNPSEIACLCDTMEEANQVIAAVAEAADAYCGFVQALSDRLDAVATHRRDEEDRAA